VAAAGTIVVSVDIEGPDFDVTVQMLETGLRPDVLVVEVLRASESDGDLIRGYGYEMVAHRGWNHIYVRRSSQSGPAP